MREVKFRAWDKIFEKMIQVTDLNLKTGYLIGEIDTKIVSCKFKDCELLQYTGLKDKNGIEIYEGDIVENGNGKVGYILFQIQAGGLVVVIKDRDYRIGHRNNGEGYHTSGNHKVIGNVYTSQELLEGSAE